MKNINRKIKNKNQKNSQEADSRKMIFAKHFE